MIQLALSKEEKIDIAEALDDPALVEHHRTKLLVLRMHSEGAKTGFISKVLCLHRNTVTNHLREYRDGGLAASLEDRFYRPSSSLAPFVQCLRCDFRIRPVTDAKEAVKRIEARTNVRLSESQARRWMKAQGMKLRKTCPIPGKADPQLQLDFYTSELLPRLEQARDSKRKVFFVDAAHFVMGAFLGMVWCFTRVFTRTSPGRQRYNVLGAIDSHNQELISIRTTQNINSHTIVELLEKIHAKYPDHEITLVMDNARYQRCNFVKEHAQDFGIELLFLPPYSPNLNLIERLWKLTKKRCLTNKHYKDFSAFCYAIDNCLEQLAGPLKQELQTLMAPNFQLFQKHNS